LSPTERIKQLLEGCDSLSFDDLRQSLGIEFSDDDFMEVARAAPETFRFTRVVKGPDGTPRYPGPPSLALRTPHITAG
jgi:hypothetical protein